MTDYYPCEKEIYGRIEVFGRNIFNLLSSNDFTYGLNIIGKESDGYAPTVEFGNYYGIIFIDDKYHLYKKKLIKNSEKPVYKRSRIFSDKDLDRVVEELYIKLVHRRIKELIHKRKKLSESSSMEEIIKSVYEINNPSDSNIDDI